MLRLRDARTRELTDVLPTGRRELRILVSAPGQVRAYLTADLLRRAAEKSALLPLVTDLVPAGTDVQALRAACDALNVHPPRDTLVAEAPGPSEAPGRSEAPGMPAAPGMPEAPGPSEAPGLSEAPPFDVGITVGERMEGAAMARLWIAVAVDETSVTLGDEALPVRLALLGNRYDTAVTAGHDEVSTATQALGRWRRLVAEWARSPSVAMARPYADAVRDAFADDLDAPAALTALAALVDDESVPAGAKFETFAAADMLLGLDLARDIGK